VAGFRYNEIIMSKTGLSREDPYLSKPPKLVHHAGCAIGI